MHTRDGVSTREFHKIWTEQCEAAHDIRLRYGPRAAFDYVVAEKLLNFAEAAGVGRHTIYRWWPTKGAVVAEAMTHGARAIVPPRATGSFRCRRSPA